MTSEVHITDLECRPLLLQEERSQFYTTILHSVCGEKQQTTFATMLQSRALV